MDEKLLIRRAQNGDINAFEELVRASQNKIYAVCLRMLNNADDAFDAAQETLIKAFRKLDGFRAESGFSTWLYRIAKNVCLDIIRKRRQEIISLEDMREGGKEPADDPENRPEAHHLKREQASEVRRLLALLPPELQAVLLLRYMDEYSYLEIADILGISEGTVKSRIYRGKEQLRRLYRSHGS